LRSGPTSRNGEITVPHVIGKSVSVGFEEINSQDLKEKVYKPEIRDMWDKLYKKPGYEL
jgi:hypothetical protein